MMKTAVKRFPRLGERLVKTRDLGSIAKKKQEEEIVLGLTVLVRTDEGGTKYRWYGLLPPRGTGVQKFKDGIAVLKSVGSRSSSGRRCLTTQVKRSYPSLLHEFSTDFLCNSVALNSKFHLTGHHHIFHLDPLSGQFNVAYKHSIIPSQKTTTVVLDGKVYYFTRSGQTIICQVFHPNTNQWQTFPAPKDDYPPHEICPIIKVAVYENQKKLLVISDMVAARTFDVATNSWERGWDFPSPVIHFMARGYYPGEGHVIAADLLYMFDSEEYRFQAYDLQKKQLLEVHGLQNLAFLFSARRDRGQQPTYLFPLGNQELCLVTSTASAEAAAGLHVLCLNLHVQKRGDGLHVVIRGRDDYFMQDAVAMAECVAIKRPGL